MKKNLNHNKLLIAFSIFEAFLQVYGFLLSNNKSIIDFNIISFLITFAISIILFIFNYWIFKILEHVYVKNNSYVFSKKNIFIRAFFIILFWIPVLLAYYPIIWSYDIYNQIPHIINTRVSANQPIFHTLIIEFFLFIGKFFNSYKFGMLLISLFQMFFMAITFSFAIEKFSINNKKVMYIFNIILVIYFGIMPFNSVMVISCTKDVIFTGLIIWLMLIIYDFIDFKKFNKKNIIKYIVISVLLLLIKNNSIYLYLFFIIIFIIYFRNYIKKIIVMCIIPIIIYSLINNFFIIIFNPWPNLKVEMYSVPIQNLMYTVLKHPNEDVNYNEYLFGFVKRDKFSKNLEDDYKPNIVDDFKYRFSAATNDDVDEIKLMETWLKFGLKYPVDYVDSWANLTRGAWYLFDESHTKQYVSNNENRYLLIDFFDIENFDVKKNDIILKSVNNLLNKFLVENKQYKSLNIIRFIFCPATYVLFFLLLIIYHKKNKNYSELIPLSLFFALLISVLLGPTIIIRYIYPFMVVLPIIILRLIYINNKER